MRESIKDAVDALFVRCIASTDNLKAFTRAASLVRRLSLTPEREHFGHLASALDEQRAMLQMLRTSSNRQAREHADRRDDALKAFLEAQQSFLDSFLRF